MSTARNIKHPVNRRQIKILHTLANSMGWDRDTYQANLAEQTGKESSKDLSWREAEGVIEDWTRKAIALGVWKAKTAAGGSQLAAGEEPTANSQDPRPLRWSDLDGRPGFASGAQCRLIEGMWGQVSRMSDPESREWAMFSFLQRICRVSHFRFLKSWQVEKVIRALEGMGAEKRVKGEKSKVKRGEP